MLFKTKLFRNVTKIFYTLKKKFLIVQNSFSLALFSLFFGFLCGNLFGTFLDTLRIYFLWNGFVAFIILLFVEAINFFVYRIPLTEQRKTNFSVSNVRNFNFLLRRNIRPLFNLHFFLYPKEKVNTLLTQYQLRKPSTYPFTPSGYAKRRAPASITNEVCTARQARTGYRLATRYPERFAEQRDMQNKVAGEAKKGFVLPSWQKGYTKKSDEHLDFLPRKVYPARGKGAGAALVDKNKRILFTIYIERNLNAFKIGLLFGFFIDSFKVGS